MLLSVIPGTASAAHNLGALGALGVGGYIAFAGLWSARRSVARRWARAVIRAGAGERRLDVPLGVHRRPAARRGDPG